MAGTPGVTLPGVLPHQFGACLRRYGKTHRRQCLVRTTTTTTTTTRARLSKSCQHQCGDSVSLVSSCCNGLPRRTCQRWKAPQGAPSSPVASPRAVHGADGLVRSSPPRCAVVSTQPQGTEDAQGRWAGGRPEGARAASGSGARGVPTNRSSPSVSSRRRLWQRGGRRKRRKRRRSRRSARRRSTKLQTPLKGHGCYRSSWAKGGGGKRGGKRDFLELPLLVLLAWLDSGYVFLRQSSRLLFHVLLLSTVDTCTCLGLGNFTEESHTTST